VAEHGELGHRRLEAARHERLLVHEALPEAGRARVVRERKVGLETHLARVVTAADGERRLDLAGVAGRSWEADAIEEDLEEDLGIERERRLRARPCGQPCSYVFLVHEVTHCVEGRGVDRRVDLVRTSDRVGCEQGHHLERRKVASIGEPRQDLVYAVRRLGDKPVDGGDRCVRPAREELELWRAGAVAQRDRACELDEVASADRVAREERDQVVDAVVDTVVCGEVGLDGREEEHRAVGATAGLGTLALRDGDRVVEGETDDLVGWRTTSQNEPGDDENNREPYRPRRTRSGRECSGGP
jgi:hypothetical protein